MRKSIDFNLEALRGFCALMVLIHHCIINSSALTPGFEFRRSVIPYTPSGHLMVMIFFMLSGYVIGYTSLNREFELSTYIKKRLVRLYPIYLIAILITILLFSENIRSIIATVFFMQNLFSDVIEHNNPLWSLNHEVVYYLLVIPILFYGIKPNKIYLIVIFLLSASLFKLRFSSIIEGYLVGFLFWLTGFTVSKIKVNSSEGSVIAPGILFSIFFLLLSCDFLNAFNLNKIFMRLPLLHGTAIHTFSSMVNLSDFSFLPSCLYAIITVSATRVRWYKYLTAFVYLASWIPLLFFIANGSFFKVNIFYMPAFFLIVSTILRFVPIKIFNSISFWTFIGSISYSIYVIHMPILLFIGKFDFLGGTITSFPIKTIIVFAISICISWVLEKKLQPLIRDFFQRSKIEKATIE